MASGLSGEFENKGRNRGLILVVEDDLGTLRLERVVLEEEGFAVREARSGEEALQALDEGTTALVLLDIGLPGIDGFTTCGRIRKTSQVPIIIVTAEDKDEDKVYGLEMGADDYVTKPFSTAELAARVKAVLRRYDLASIGTQSAIQTGASFKNGAMEQTGASIKTGAIDQTGASTEAGGADQTGASTEAGGADQTGASTEAGGADQTRASTKTGAIEQTGASTEAGGADQTGAATKTGAIEQTGASTETGSVARNPSSPDDPQGQDPSGLLEYEGTVRLLVESSGSVKKMIRFVDDLRQHPLFRLLRLNANPNKEGMEILLRMREPVRLKGILLQLEDVSAVEEQPNTPNECPPGFLRTGTSTPEGPVVRVALRE